MNATETARTSSTAPPPAEVRSLEEAFARYQGELLGTLFYLVGDAEDARDALQETFVKCWRHRRNVADIRNLKSWIFRIALNTGRDMRKTAWRRRKKALGDDEQIVDHADNGPERIMERQEQLARLQKAIAELRQEEQEVFLLRQNGEMTYDEIAEAMGIPTGTVKTRMRLAISKLRVVMAVGGP